MLSSSWLLHVSLRTARSASGIDISTRSQGTAASEDISATQPSFPGVGRCVRCPLVGFPALLVVRRTSMARPILSLQTPSFVCRYRLISCINVLAVHECYSSLPVLLLLHLFKHIYFHLGRGVRGKQTAGKTVEPGTRDHAGAGQARVLYVTPWTWLHLTRIYNLASKRYQNTPSALPCY